MHYIAELFSGGAQDVKELVTVGGAFGVAIVAIMCVAIRKIVSIRAREHTKRELAAYVAEGSMKAEEAERILKSDSPRSGGCC